MNDHIQLVDRGFAVIRNEPLSAEELDDFMDLNLRAMELFGHDKCEILSSAIREMFNTVMLSDEDVLPFVFLTSKWASISPLPQVFPFIEEAPQNAMAQFDPLCNRILNNKALCSSVTNEIGPISAVEIPKGITYCRNCWSQAKEDESCKLCTKP